MKEKKLPLVTVVVPCYNHDKYVKETIESIVNQTYKNIELIVIDDGSSDNSVQVIQELADKYKFTFIYRPNKGLSATLNEAIKLSKGKYFAGCASDDIYMLDKIEKQVEFMEQNPQYGMCYGKITQFEESGLKAKKLPVIGKSGWIFKDLLYGCLIATPSTFIKKIVLDDVGEYDEKLWIEDWDMWLRIAQKYQIGFINEYFTYYRRHDTNISKQIFKMYEAEKQLLEKYKEHVDYKKVMNKRKIIWFSALSREHKKEALIFLPHSIKYFLINPRVLIGLFKLLFLRK